MKLYKMIWYLTDRPALNGLELCYESLIPLINNKYKLIDKELRSLSLGDLDEFKVLDQYDTIL
jgi:hypothetical protein